MEPTWQALYDIAAAQEGLFTTKQAAAAGYSPPLLAHYQKTARIARIRRGIYRGSFWQLAATSGRASTTRVSTRFSLLCRCPGRELSFNTQAACIGIIHAKSKFEYTTTSIAKYLCSCACLKSG
jgi:Transcriptional regulator, AbiEi antitoxin